MKRGEKGYTLVELVLAMAIMVVISGAAMAATFQVCRGTEGRNNHITAVRQVHNAGYWISRDAQMAQSTTADNLTPPNFLVLNWTEWDQANDPIYHSVTYFFEDLTDGIGKLKRYHWSSVGTNRHTLIAKYIYYNSGDSEETSNVEYQSPELTVRLTAIFEEVRESREYRVIHRPNF